MGSVVPYLSSNMGTSLTRLPTRILGDVARLEVEGGLPLIVMFNGQIYFVARRKGLVGRVSRFTCAIGRSRFSLVFEHLYGCSIRYRVSGVVGNFVAIGKKGEINIYSSTMVGYNHVASIGGPASLGVEVTGRVGGYTGPILGVLCVGGLPDVVITTPPNNNGAAFLHSFTELLSNNFGGGCHGIYVVSRQGRVTYYASSNSFTSVKPGASIIYNFPGTVNVRGTIHSLSPRVVIYSRVSSLGRVRTVGGNFLDNTTFTISIRTNDVERLVGGGLLRSLISANRFRCVIFLGGCASRFRVARINTR